MGKLCVQLSVRVGITKHVVVRDGEMTGRDGGKRICNSARLANDDERGAAR